jgi:hypothetical protein
MRAYVRDVENRDEIIQVLNSQIEKVILPEVGDTILEKYVVIDREWLSLEGDKDKINLWVKTIESYTVSIKFFKRIRSFMGVSTNLELIEEKSILKTKLKDIFIPRIGESIQLGEEGNLYKVSDVVKVGDPIEFKEIKVILDEQ